MWQVFAWLRLGRVLVGLGVRGVRGRKIVEKQGWPGFWGSVRLWLFRGRFEMHVRSGVGLGVWIDRLGWYLMEGGYLGSMYFVSWLSSWISIDIARGFVSSSFRSNWKTSYPLAIRLLRALVALAVQVVSREVPGIDCDIFHLGRNIKGTIVLLPIPPNSSHTCSRSVYIH